MKRILILVLLTIQCSLFTIHCPAQNQHQVDSLLDALKKQEAAKKELGSKAPAMYDTTAANILIDLSKAFLGNNPDTAMYFANQALALSGRIGYKKGISNAYNSMGIINDDKGDYLIALEFNKKAMKISEEIGDKSGIIRAYNLFGNIYSSKGNFPEALKNYFACLKISEEIGLKNGVANSHNNIGLIYDDQGNYPEALKNYLAALKIYEEIGYKLGIAMSYNNIGRIYYSQGNSAEALKNYLSSLKISEEIGVKQGIAYSYNNIGAVYDDQGNYSEALKNFLASLKIKEEIGDKEGIAGTYNSIGRIYIKEKKFYDASEYLNKGLSLSIEIGSLEWMKESYMVLAQLDSAQGKFNKALEHYKLYITIRDSLVNNENTKKTMALQMNYEIDKKEKEIALLKSQQVIDRLNKSRTLGIIFGMGGALVGMIFVAMAFYSQRNKISKEKKISEMERNRSDELLLNILPAEVAEELKQKGSADAKEFVEASVMFTDFKDFTTISEKMTPSELVKEIDYCFSAFDNIIHKHGIEKIKTIGDAYMCAGGLPVANKTHAEDTVKAALEIRDFMANHNKEKVAKGELPFEIRIGINTGPVVAGIVGVKKFAYDIWGDTVNLASRMESSGKEGEVNISGSTFELVKDKFTCSHRGKIMTKNKGEVDMYFVN